jgi:hypothetical protein
MHHNVGQRLGAVQIEERVDVVGDVVHLDQVALLLFEDAFRIGVHAGKPRLRQQGCTAFRAENKVDENPSKGLGYENLPLMCRTLSACNLSENHVPRALPWESEWFPAWHPVRVRRKADAAGGYQWIAPFGGAAGRLATNPLSLAVPTEAGDPLVVDVATSVAPEGKMRTKLAAGQPIPLGWAVDHPLPRRVAGGLISET